MKTKFTSFYAVAVDKEGGRHYVTVVGKLTQGYFPKKFEQDVPVEVKPGVTVKGKLTFTKRTVHRKLTVGVSICHPTDKFDESFGIELAKARIEKGRDAGSVETNSVTMLTEDLVEAELLGKLSYICANIDSYLHKI